MYTIHIVIIHFSLNVKCDVKLQSKIRNALQQEANYRLLNVEKSKSVNKIVIQVYYGHEPQLYTVHLCCLFINHKKRNR
jgi:hypothetical protein